MSSTAVISSIFFLSLIACGLNQTTTRSNPSPNVILELKGCKTAKKINGFCVERLYCDYGTPGIDLTLYAPRGYIKTCTPAEVCCPPDSILDRSAPTKEPNYEVINDDDF